MNPTEKRCKNCRQHLLLHQKFCHECGQNTDTHRINFHFLVHEVQHGIFHVDGGILYTLKQLFTRPGHTLREYLEGRRRQHFKPLMLVLILGSVCALIQYFLKEDKEVNTKKNVTSNLSASNFSKYINVEGLVGYLKHVVHWLGDHFAFTVLLMIPAAAFSFYLGFRKYRYNYPEWLVIMLFLTGQSLAVYIFFIFLHHFAGVGNGIFYLISWLMITFSLVQFFQHKRKRSVILRSVWSMLLAYFISFIYLTIAFLIVFVIGIMRYGYDNIIPRIMN